MARNKKNARKKTLAESATILIIDILEIKDDSNLFKNSLKEEIEKALLGETVTISCTGSRVDNLIENVAKEAMVEIKPKPFSLVISTNEGIILLSVEK